MRPELVHWLTDQGFPRHNVRYLSIQARDATQVANHAVYLAMQRNMPYSLFIDGDVVPTTNTVLDLQYHINCARANTGNPNSFADPHDFHSAFWFARTSDLRRIKPPWFQYPGYVPGRLHVSQCYCAHFAASVKAANLTIGWTGYVHHVPSKPDPTEDFICP